LYPIILAELNTSGLKIPEVSGLSPILLASYDKNEKIRSIGYGLDNGTAHGTYLYFNKKGNIKGKYNYTLGEIDGEFVLYGSNGKPWLCGNYKNGKRDGPWEYSTPDGNIYKTIIFVDGRKIEKIR
jgi:antitoxin component YwqK of YwqJK toxin-antitoxin module